jgi:hypothetical protein
VALVEVVFRCHSRTSGGGALTDRRDSEETVDPPMGAEKEHRPLIIPQETAQLSALPRPHHTLGKRGLDLADVGRQTGAVGPAGAAGTDPHIQQMIAQSRGSIQVIEVQAAVGVAPWSDEFNDCMVKYSLSSVVPTFASEYAEVQKVAIGSHGVQLIPHGDRLPFDDGYPVGMALEPDHGFIYSEVTTWDVVFLEETLALMVEGRSLLDNGLSLIASDRRSDVKVAVKLYKAIAGHELRDVGVAVGGFPVCLLLCIRLVGGFNGNTDKTLCWSAVCVASVSGRECAVRGWVVGWC